MTVVGVARDDGRARLRLVSGNLAARLIRADATGAQVALVATTALLLGGDRVDLELSVGPGAWLEIVETAGTVAYDAAGAPCSWNVRAVLGEGAMLLWQGLPFVVSDGANAVRSSTFELSVGSMACVRETLVLGRTGERGGAVRIRNRATASGVPVLVEDLDLTDQETRELPGILGAATVIDSLTLLGMKALEAPAPAATPAPAPAGTVFQLDAGLADPMATARGSVGRVLRTGLAGSPVAAWWPAWRAQAEARYRHEMVGAGTS